jgi:hyperosmotically inducible protein
MPKKTFHPVLTAPLALACALVLPVAGCGRGQEIAGDQGPDHKVEIQRGAQGTEIEFHSSETPGAPEASEAQRHLDQAGRQLGQGARELGAAVAQGARSVGKQVAPAARQAGQELQQGARELGQKLGPAAQQAGQQLKQAGREVGQQVGPALSDAAITASIKAKLLAGSEFNGSHIDVTTSGGEVTLSGSAATPEQRAAAKQVALKTDGVRRIVDNIVVGKS